LTIGKTGMESYDSYKKWFNDAISTFRLGADIEEAHMRNRQWVSAWAFEKGKNDNVIEKN
jgi:dipeptidyl-peptidase-3